MELVNDKKRFKAAYSELRDFRLADDVIRTDQFNFYYDYKHKFVFMGRDDTRYFENVTLKDWRLWIRNYKKHLAG